VSCREPFGPTIWIPQRGLEPPNIKSGGCRKNRSYPHHPLPWAKRPYRTSMVFPALTMPFSNQIWNRRLQLTMCQLPWLETVSRVAGGISITPGTLPPNMVWAQTTSAVYSACPMGIPSVFFQADFWYELSRPKLAAFDPTRLNSRRRVCAHSVRGPQYGEGVLGTEKVAALSIRTRSPLRKSRNGNVSVAPEISTSTIGGGAGFPPLPTQQASAEPRRSTEICHPVSRRMPFQLFPERSLSTKTTAHEQLVIQIQTPGRNIRLSFGPKFRDPSCALDRWETVSFEYSSILSQMPITVYEICLYDCMIGRRPTLFSALDMVEGRLERSRSCYWTFWKQCSA